MQVRLVTCSEPCAEYFEGTDVETVQDLVGYCARVSNPSNQTNTETIDKLIAYLVRKKHWSPFEMVSACLELKTTRDIGRQILRHRSFSFQEFSQRYADPTKNFEFEYREARLQDEKNRQSSIEIDDKDLNSAWIQHQKNVAVAAEYAYKWAVSKGIAKEVARAVLPEGLTPTVMYMNGTIRSWIHYIDLRTGEETQKEHREIAKACAEAILKIFPLINTFSH